VNVLTIVLTTTALFTITTSQFTLGIVDDTQVVAVEELTVQAETQQHRQVLHMSVALVAQAVEPMVSVAATAVEVKEHREMVPQVASR
jgi:hypothetical protein